MWLRLILALLLAGCSRSPVPELSSTFEDAAALSEAQRTALEIPAELVAALPRGPSTPVFAVPGHERAFQFTTTASVASLQARGLRRIFERLDASDASVWIDATESSDPVRLVVLLDEPLANSPHFLERLPEPIESETLFEILEHADSPSTVHLVGPSHLELEFAGPVCAELYRELTDPFEGAPRDSAHALLATRRWRIPFQPPLSPEELE